MPKQTLRTLSRAWALVFLVLASSWTLAGPPLVQDDAGIVDPGQWEVIIAIKGESRD